MRIHWSVGQWCTTLEALTFLDKKLTTVRYECFLTNKDTLNPSSGDLTCQWFGYLLSCDNNCISGLRMYNIHDRPLALNLLWIEQI